LRLGIRHVEGYGETQAVREETPALDEPEPRKSDFFDNPMTLSAHPIRLNGCVMKTKTLLIASLLIGSLNAQEKPADPYRAPSATAAKTEPEPQPVISICYENFSVPLSMAAALQREKLTDSALYGKLIAELGKDAVRQEILQVLRCGEGHIAKTESVSESIYPTEYSYSSEYSYSEYSYSADSSQQHNLAPKAAPPATSGPRSDLGSGERVPALPNAFDTRNTGHTLELEATLSADRGGHLDLRIAPESVALVGRTSYGQEFSTTEMPEFESQRLKTRVTAKLDGPTLLGTMSRPPVSRVDPDSANRVWFAFVTPTLVMP
jgi:hypothetical protein